MKTKLILMAHGSSSKEWSDAFVDMTAQVREDFDDAELAFMELSTPSLEQSCTKAKADGYDRVQVLPLFLAVGRHLKKDVPAMIAQYEQELELSIELLPPIGHHPAIAKAMHEAARDYLQATNDSRDDK
jgi:sirohydrochlorin cobaltochelatase